MNVSLPDDLIAFVREEVGRGGYGNNSDVVRASLRLLRERREEQTMLRGLLDEGLAEITAGKDTPLTRAELRAIADEAKANASRRGAAS